MRADRLISMLFEARENPLIRKSRRKFGLTGDPVEGGYILPSGRMLDFSGKRDGGPPGTRAYDHRDINAVVDTDYDSGIEYVKHFLRSTGAIRMSYSRPTRPDDESYLLLHFAHPPTSAQRRTIAGMRPDSLKVDVDHPVTGERIHSGEHTRADMGSGLSTAYKVAETHAVNK